MPTVFREGPYRLYWYSHEPNEPPHVHVDKENCTAKYWLNPVRLSHFAGFATHELTRIRGIIEANQEMLLDRWYEYFRKTIR